MNGLWKKLLSLGLLAVLLAVVWEKPGTAETVSPVQPAMEATAPVQSAADVIPPAQPAVEPTPASQVPVETVPPAQPPGESLPPLQQPLEISPPSLQDPGLGSSVRLAGSGGVSRQSDAGAVVPATAPDPAVGLVKVTRLEPGVASSPAAELEDRQLELRRADFLKFAERKLQEMNRNHILSRERMRVEKRADGSYQALFHQLDDSSFSCQVSRSPSRAAQFVAVLSYKERVFSASCATPAECRQGGDFAPVEVIPNRHIFVYNNGNWQ